MNDSATIVRCKVKGDDKIPFRLFKFPTIKLFKLHSAKRSHSIVEYFGDPESLEGYVTFLREEGSIAWFDKEKDDLRNRSINRSLLIQFLISQF